MKIFAKAFGGLGAICLVFGLVATVLFQGQGHLQAVSISQVILGLIGIGIYLAYYTGEVFKVVTRQIEVFYGLLGGALILFLLIGVNVVSQSKFGERKFDTTVNKVHSLSSESLTLVKHLPDSISVMAFFDANARERELLKDLMKKYTYESNQIQFQIYDPDQEPALMKSYEANKDEVIVRNEKTKKAVKLTGMTEQDITSAIKKVVNAVSKTVYFIQGHGEGSLEGDLSSGEVANNGLQIAKLLLENEGFKVLPLALTGLSELPKDASIVAAWGAQRPYSKTEIDLLENFLARGGSLVVAQDPLIGPTKDRLIASGFDPLLQKYGLVFQPGIVLERQLQLLRGQVITSKLTVTDYGKHKITERLNGQSVTEFALAQPISLWSDYKGDAKRTPLITTSANAWAETDIGGMLLKQKASKASEKPSPLVLGEIAEWTTPNNMKDPISNTGRLIVFGDADFGANAMIQGGYNRDLFLNTFGFLGGEEISVSIRPKTWTTSTLEITEAQSRFIDFASIFIIPEFVMGLGFMIWLMRRSRA